MPPRRAPASPTMLRALGLARLGGDRLERRRGGFWTYPGCPERRSGPDMVPETYVDIRTVEACVARGLLRREGPGFDAPAALTDHGLALLAVHDPATFAPLRATPPRTP